MAYRLTLAINDGSMPWKRRMARRRAEWVSLRSGAGRIGTTAEKLSSLASISAMRRKKISPFFGEIIDRCAEIATRNSTASGVGVPKSSELSDPHCSTGTPAPHSEALLPRWRKLNHNNTQRVQRATVALVEAATP